MRIGCSIGLNGFTERGYAGKSLAAALLGSGFDYVEGALVSFAQLPAKDFEDLRKNLDVPKIEAFNCFFPGDLKLVGETANLSAIKEYADKAVGRAAMLGAEVIVFGSGGPRAVPDGFPPDQARDQLIGVLKIVSDKAAAYKGLTIAIEPLNKKETNLINSLRDGALYVQLADRPNIRLLADYYHMARENEPAASVGGYGPILAHVHFADPDGRVYPKAPKDEFEEFFKALRAAGYNRRVSFECGGDPYNDGTAALKMLREAFLK